MKGHIFYSRDEFCHPKAGSGIYSLWLYAALFPFDCLQDYRNIAGVFEAKKEILIRDQVFIFILCSHLSQP